jgi:hypothetical protein
MHYYSGRCLRQGSKSKSFKASTSHCNRILLIPKIGLLVGILSLLSRLVGPAHSRVDLLHCSGYPFFCYAPHIDPIKRSLIEGILPHDELGRAPSYLGPFSSGSHISFRAGGSLEGFSPIFFALFSSYHVNWLRLGDFAEGLQDSSFPDRDNHNLFRRENQRSCQPFHVRSPYT